MDPLELAARVEARLRLFFSGLEGGDSILPGLPGRQGRLFYILLRAEGRILSRESLSVALWGSTGEGSRRLDMLVSKLRSRLAASKGFEGHRIRAFRNEGYALYSEPVDNLCEIRSPAP